jgi:uncharacterized protein YndB with AHSA1/START domain
MSTGSTGNTGSTDNADEQSTGFTIVRTFDASPAELWRAWTDPDIAARWFHPREVVTPRESVEIDARVGGRYTYTMIHTEHGEFPVVGEYLEVTEPERLVFTWADPAGGVDPDAVITVSLRDVGDGRTEQTFDLRGLAGHPGDDGVYDGWGQALDFLEAEVERG